VRLLLRNLGVGERCREEAFHLWRIFPTRHHMTDVSMSRVGRLLSGRSGNKSDDSEHRGTERRAMMCSHGFLQARRILL
jgi:hypothetical protein